MWNTCTNSYMFIWICVIYNQTGHIGINTDIHILWCILTADRIFCWKHSSYFIYVQVKKEEGLKGKAWATRNGSMWHVLLMLAFFTYSLFHSVFCCFPPLEPFFLLGALPISSILIYKFSSLYMLLFTGKYHIVHVHFDVAYYNIISYSRAIMVHTWSLFLLFSKSHLL